jgi:hypothetical protein
MLMTIQTQNGPRKVGEIEKNKNNKTQNKVEGEVGGYIVISLSEKRKCRKRRKKRKERFRRPF